MIPPMRCSGSPTRLARMRSRNGRTVMANLLVVCCPIRDQPCDWPPSLCCDVDLDLPRFGVLTQGEPHGENALPCSGAGRHEALVCAVVPAGVADYAV